VARKISGQPAQIGPGQRQSCPAVRCSRLTNPIMHVLYPVPWWVGGTTCMNHRSDSLVALDSKEICSPVLEVEVCLVLMHELGVFFSQGCCFSTQSLFFYPASKL
jgi:hypothetical protein